MRRGISSPNLGQVTPPRYSELINDKVRVETRYGEMFNGTLIEVTDAYVILEFASGHSRKMLQDDLRGIIRG
jgi:hypothetical protein